jgi:hypothetical protein
MTCVTCAIIYIVLTFFPRSELNMHAMRMGPGKHLQGRVLMNGLVTPEGFDYFHEVNLYWNNNK